jgi:hypothetical protein
MMETKSLTPECDKLDQMRQEFEQLTSAPYLCLMRLAKKLEIERNILKEKLEKQ